MDALSLPSVDLTLQGGAVTAVAGPKINTAFQRALCDAPESRADTCDTVFIEREFGSLSVEGREEGAAATAVIRLCGLDQEPKASRREATDASQLGGDRSRHASP